MAANISLRVATINDPTESQSNNIQTNPSTNQPPVLTKIEKEINFAMTLDLTRRPRIIRSGLGEVQIHGRKQASNLERTMVLFTAKRWGWMDPALTRKKQQRIAKAACTQIAYDYGFKSLLASTQLTKWNLLLNDSIENGVLHRDNPLSPLHIGSKKYVESIEKEHPGYLRSLFRYAQ